MTYKISLKEQRAQVVVNTMNNGTKIVGEPDQEGWVTIVIEINNDYDALSLYHAGMEAKAQQNREWEEARKTA